MATYRLITGDCRIELSLIADCSIDSVVCDPPYEMGFMGKAWDRSGIAYQVEVWRECLRVLKHGGHLLAFGGSRTYHRLACAIEDAGFEIRDDIDFWYDANPIFAAFYDSLGDEQKEALHASAGASHLSWIYGSGFPKSRNVAKVIAFSSFGQPEDRSSWAMQWDGWGTGLKPAHEPIVLARKPLIGTVAENVLQHGTGGLNIDGCRISTDELTPRNNKIGDNGWKNSSGGYIEPSPLGRWPANVIHDGSEEVMARFPVTTSGANCYRTVRHESGSMAGSLGAPPRRRRGKLWRYWQRGSDFSIALKRVRKIVMTARLAKTMTQSKLITSQQDVLKLLLDENLRLSVEQRQGDGHTARHLSRCG